MSGVQLIYEQQINTQFLEKKYLCSRVLSFARSKCIRNFFVESEISFKNAEYCFCLNSYTFNFITVFRVVNVSINRVVWTIHNSKLTIFLCLKGTGVCPHPVLLENCAITADFLQSGRS